MDSKLKAKLVNALKQAGMGEGVASIFEDKTEEEVNSFISELTGIKPEKPSVDQLIADGELDAWLKDNSFDQLLNLSKAAQSEHDRKVNSAIKTFVKKRFDTDEPDDSKKGGGAPAGEDMPEWAKGLVTQIEGLKGRLEGEAKRKTAQEALAASKLPKRIQEAWVSRIVMESETPITDQVASLEKEYKEVFVAQLGAEAGEIVEGQQTGGNGKMSKADLDAITKFAQTGEV